MTYIRFSIPEVLVLPFLCMVALALFGLALRFVVKVVTGK